MAGRKQGQERGRKKMLGQFVCPHPPNVLHIVILGGKTSGNKIMWIDTL